MSNHSTLASTHPHTATLVDRHQRELHKSGISAEVTAERGCFTATDPSQLRTCGFSERQAQRVPALVWPLHDTQGCNSRYAIKPDEPRIDRDGKPLKYELPLGQLTIIDVPRRCQSSLLDPTVALWITEGYKKGDALASAGKCAIALNGGWGWCHKDEKGNSGTPRPDWEPILPTLDGRRVFICFDSDAADNEKNVGLAERRLTNFLREHGAWVSTVRLAPGPNGEKVGVDDYIVTNGSAALDALAEQAPIDGGDDVRALRGLLEKREAEVRQLKELIRATAAVLSNPSMHPTEKLVLIATSKEAARHMNGSKSGDFMLRNATIARATGLSDDTVSKSMTRLAGTGIFDKRVIRSKSAEGEFKSETRLTVLVGGGAVDMLQAGATLAPRYDGKWGGSRKCPQHPGAKVIRTVSYVCSECGQVLPDENKTLKLQDAVSGEVTPLCPITLVTPPGDTSSPSPHSVTKGPQVAVSHPNSECRSCGGTLSPAEQPDGVHSEWCTPRRPKCRPCGRAPHTPNYVCPNPQGLDERP